MSVPLILLALGFFGSQAQQKKPAQPRNEPKQPRTELTASPAVAPVARSPRVVAEQLRAFLESTGKFGTANNRIAEVLDAQRALGVTGEDGIVGPKTRKATRALGVVLPLRKRVT